MALQGIEVEGVIIKEYPAKEGVSKTTNNPWKSQEFVIQTKDQYPRACLFRVFGADRIQQFNIHEGDALRKQLVSLAIGNKQLVQAEHTSTLKLEK